ncbi:3-oxoadipate enol-lactonase [Methylobacterium sp. 275MFSha3.1]|uniref:alpha/beta fold hydrolase n=1 Tax=Methylobacterium sp. 275MFSha3.1 TaxID=1502746 RepID=UPI0008A74ACF|nr:alpha/beta fold hydrolase [Methylobacterium sp. 275MFSha3.1]SEH92152.1 3-oxoadipate enol-lactonase [Methylobacterium sp. 275MFSha3.1]
MQAMFADGQVAVTASGEGPPLVLLHSLLADRTSFDRVTPALGRDFRLLVPDLPGFGASAPAPGGLEAVADRVGAALRAATGGRPAAGLGNGYGGFVLLLCALRHPDLFDRLVFADCGACFPEPGRAAFRGMAGAAAEKGLAALADTAMRRLFAPAFQAAHPDLMAERRAAFLRTDVDVFRAACAALAGLDLRARLSEIRAPALVLVGEEDEATPPAMARELAAGLPDARFVTLPDCAHVPQLQAPEIFAREVLAFLRPGAA